MVKKIKILIFSEFYLPGFKGGGPISSISNMIKHLGFKSDFYVVTRSNDLNDDTIYPGIRTGEWNVINGTNIFYLPPGRPNLFLFYQILSNRFDYIYLNSFFNFYFSFIPLLLAKVKNFTKKIIIIAPRGELFSGALKNKIVIKYFFIYIFKSLGLYKNIRWHATSFIESKILSNFFNIDKKDLFVAPNFPHPKISISNLNLHLKQIKASNKNFFFQLLFFSRITPKKNLLFLIQALKHVNVNCVLYVIGPIEDKVYFAECKNLTKSLPKKIYVKFSPEKKLPDIFNFYSQFDLFVLPTKGENFGHVILESLASGLPVLISDNTPWLEDKRGSVEVLEVNDPSQWSRSIEKWIALDKNEMLKRKKSAIRYTINYLKSSQVFSLNLKLFDLKQI